MSIKAYHNEHLLSEDDNRPLGVEIYKDGTSEIDLEFYSTMEEVNARIDYINDLKSNNWEEIGSYDLGDFKTIKEIEEISGISFQEWLINYGANDVSEETSKKEFRDWFEEMKNIEDCFNFEEL